VSKNNFNNLQKNSGRIDTFSEHADQAFLRIAEVFLDSASADEG
jgi:hypothetical protein